MASQYYDQWYNIPGQNQYMDEYGTPANAPTWWTGAGYYDVTQSYDWSGMPTYSYTPQGQNLTNTFTAGGTGLGTWDPAGATSTIDPAGNTYWTDNSAYQIPKFDFGQISSGWTQVPTGLGMNQNAIDYLNQQYGQKINDWALSQLQSGNNDILYQLQPGSDSRLYVDPSGAASGGITTLFKNAGIDVNNDPLAKQYIDAFNKSYLQGQDLQSQMEHAATVGDFTKFAALAAAAFGGAGLLAALPALSAGGALAPSALGLDVAASDFAGMMAASGFDAATIASSMGAMGFAPETIYGGLQAAGTSTTGGLPGLDAALSSIDAQAGSSLGLTGMEGNAGYDVAPQTTSLTDTLQTGQDVISKLQDLYKAINAPTGSDMMDQFQQMLGGGSSGGGTPGTGGNVATSGTDLWSILGPIISGATGLQGQENSEDKLTQIYNDVKASGDYYRPWRPDIANTASQMINNPDQYLQSPAAQAMLKQAKDAMMAKDAQSGNLFNAPERVNQYLGTQSNLLNSRLNSISNYQNAMGNPNAATNAMAQLGLPLAMMQNYSPTWSSMLGQAGGAATGGGTAGTGGTAGGGGGLNDIMNLISGGGNLLGGAVDWIGSLFGSGGTDLAAQPLTDTSWMGDLFGGNTFDANTFGWLF